MTQEIIEMAQECGLVGMRPHLDGIYIESLLAFAKLVAEAEREACALLCEKAKGLDRSGWPQHFEAHELAAAIRARGQA
jgi:hypothetical protein